MPTYAFHHYGWTNAPGALSFEHLGNDDAAHAEARRILVFNDLQRVEICDGVREVGAISVAQLGQSPHSIWPKAQP